MTITIETQLQSHFKSAFLRAMPRQVWDILCKYFQGDFAAVRYYFSH